MYASEGESPWRTHGENRISRRAEPGGGQSASGLAIPSPTVSLSEAVRTCCTGHEQTRTTNPFCDGSLTDAGRSAIGAATTLATRRKSRPFFTNARTCPFMESSPIKGPAVDPAPAGRPRNNRVTTSRKRADRSEHFSLAKQYYLSTYPKLNIANRDHDLSKRLSEMWCGDFRTWTKMVPQHSQSTTSSQI